MSRLVSIRAYDATGPIGRGHAEVVEMVKAELAEARKRHRPVVHIKARLAAAERDAAVAAERARVESWSLDHVEMTA